MSEFSTWLEAWLSGYNACRDGVPNDEDIASAAYRRFEQSGAQRARRLVDALSAAAPVPSRPDERSHR